MNTRNSPGRRSIVGLVLCLGAWLAWGGASLCAENAKASSPVPQVTLQPNAEKTSYDFETELLEGTIRVDGAYHGVSRLIFKPTGRQVIDGRYSALNLFKLMSVNQVMGQPRHMERTSRAGANWVEIEWAESEDHAAAVTARYEVSRSNAIDLTVTVRSRGTYPAYELFLSSYFDKVMRPHVYLKTRPKKKEPPELVLPTFNEVFRDTLLVFPRDAHAARTCLDGRWERSERGVPTVQVCPVRYYAHGLAFLSDTDEQMAVLLMARPRDCYAISTRYFPKDEADRMTSYSAFDFSLFGDDMLPGEERTGRVRLAVTELPEGDLAKPLELYKAFIEESD